MDEDEELHELLGIGKPLYSAVDLSEKTGISVDDAKRIWRALGFVERPVEEIFFTEEDKEVLRTISDFVQSGLVGFDEIVALTRTVGRSAARIAEAEAEAMRARVRLEGSVMTQEEARQILPGILPSLERFLTHAWRRHLDAALARMQVWDPSAADEVVVIGFSDLVGYTRLSLELDEAELSQVVEELEARAQDIISTHGGRIVKMIGDEVMFAASEPAAAAKMALELADQQFADPPITLRGGLAYGPVLSQRGDIFGPVVNLARRAASAARSQTVLVSEDFHAELADSDGFFLKPIPPRRLKGFGTTSLWVLREATTEG